MNTTLSKVKVNRNRTPQEALNATGRAQYTDQKVVDSMPKASADEVEVLFFKPEPWEYTQPDYISEDDIEKAYERRNCKPADPISVAAVNEADPAFADEKPHGTHWKDDKGNWCYATFIRWNDERRVAVYCDGHGWYDNWWFAGFASSSQC